jgi:1-acyl-sn-glycerol-3-phosphate acyltransferase
VDGSDPTPEVGGFTGEWDPSLIRRLMSFGGPFFKLYFRSEVRDIDRIPAGGALVVSNHSGGPFTVDVPTLWLKFFETFGWDRPIYTLGHDLLFKGPGAAAMKHLGMIRASRENAAEALRSGAVVIVFPGGDNDAMRPTSQQAVIDFSGRTGYVTTALEAGVPIVPVVAIGAQETQLFLTRGEWLAKRLGLITRFTRVEQFPVAFGFPFGMNIGVLYNFPLPSKLVTQVLEPIDITETFGKNPDVAEVDTYVRKVMQCALDQLAAQRRFPVLG